MSKITEMRILFTALICLFISFSFFGQSPGCTDMQACNYNPDATDDDGLCEYPEDGYDCIGNCIIDIDCSGICGGNSFIDNCGECNATSVVSAGLSYPVSVTETCEIYPISPMYVISVTAVIGATSLATSDAWIYLQDASGTTLGSLHANPANYQNTSVTVDFEMPIYVSQLQLCSWWNPASLISLEFTGAEGCVIDPGCTDMQACNYNPDATDDDGLCEYPEDGYDCIGNCIIDIDCSGICGGNSFIDNCGECNATSVVSAGLSYPVSVTETCEIYPISPMYVISVTAVIGATSLATSDAWIYLQDASGTTLGSLHANPANYQNTSVTVDFEMPIYVSQLQLCSWWNPASLISLELTGAEGCVIEPGCTDMQACNYNQGANLNDDSCVYDGDDCDDGSEFTENDTYTTDCECLGNEIETCEDGIQNQDETGVDCGGAFCDACPPPPCYGTFVTLTLYDQYSDGGGTVSVNGEDFLVNTGTNTNPTSATYCVDLETCIEVVYAANDNWPDENSWEITDATTDELLASGGNASAVFGNCVPGCSDMQACNYNQEANFNDDSCVYADDACDDGNEFTENDTFTTECDCIGDEIEIVPGCTYETACNFNQEANQNDMSCIFPGDDCDDNDESTENDIYNDECECEGEALQGGCTYEAACNYDPEAEFDNNTCLFVGDPCDDEDPNTEDDEIQDDCECAGTPISTVDELDALSVLIYPNPASNNLTVDLGDLNGINTTIKLYDSLSKLIFEKQSSSTLMINVSGFAKGMYSLELSTDEQVLRSQVIIK